MNFKYLKTALISLPVAALIGSITAFFLWALDQATSARHASPWLLFMLPLAGLAIAAIYHYWGGRAAEGNNLIIDEIHKPGGGVPLRMTPMVLGGTLVTHLFGGSAGREGTAVQMGGSLAAEYSRLLKLSPEITRLILMTGIAAGFGAVFGTPLAGAVFAMEVLTFGRIEYQNALPCVSAAFLAHYVCQAWGIQHTDYHIGIYSQVESATYDRSLVGKVALAAAGFGLVGRFFAEAVHRGTDAMKAAFPLWWLRPLVGGAAVVGLAYAVGSVDYLGLGISAPPGGISILSSFMPGGADTWSWAWKLLFTVITLASGFKGGEVTTLFFIGATLGNAIASAMGAPVDLFAGLGLVAIFAGATKAPVACVVMAVELFGGNYLVYFVLACFIARMVSGKVGIYRSQR